jgi:hypothetical protein
VSSRKLETVVTLDDEGVLFGSVKVQVSEGEVLTVSILFLCSACLGDVG